MTRPARRARDLAGLACAVLAALAAGAGCDDAVPAESAADVRVGDATWLARGVATAQPVTDATSTGPVTDSSPPTVDSLPETTDTLQVTTDTLQVTTDTLQETTDTLQVTTDTLQVTTDTLPETTDTLPETTDTLQETADTQPTPDVGPTLPGAASVGLPCSSDASCGGGVCWPGDGGGTCGLACSGTGCGALCAATCPPSHDCLPDPSAGVVWCVPRDGALCRPCAGDADCAEPSGTARCVDFGAVGHFCGAACGAGKPCPAGYGCEPVGPGSQCVPLDGTCECRPGALGAVTPCASVNASGSCPGQRGCGPAGLTACSAPAPAPESCNGADDDCDGATDEGACVVDPPGPDPVASVCYPGPTNAWDVCFDLVPRSAAPAADYTWPSPAGSPSSTQYQVPTHLLDLEGLDPATKLAKNFTLGELMQEWKGRYGVYSPGALVRWQAIRTALGVPLYVNSGFRSPGYNGDLDGAATYSRHMYGDAADVTTQGATTLQAIKAACDAQGAGFSLLYETHVHCDWRWDPLDPGFYGGADATPSAWQPPPVSAWVPLPAAAPAVGEEAALEARWDGFDEGTPWVTWTVEGPGVLETVEPAPTLRLRPPRPGTYEVRWEVGGAVGGSLTLEVAPGPARARPR